MSAEKVGYKKVTNALPLVKVGPSGFFGLTAVGAVAACVVYDNTAATGDILWSGALTAGQTVSFGGIGIAAKTGIFVAVAGAEIVNVLYT